MVTVWWWKGGGTDLRYQSGEFDPCGGNDSTALMCFPINIASNKMATRPRRQKRGEPYYNTQYTVLMSLFGRTVMYGGFVVRACCGMARQQFPRPGRRASSKVHRVINAPCLRDSSPNR